MIKLMIKIINYFNRSNYKYNKISNDKSYNLHFY